MALEEIDFSGDSFEDITAKDRRYAIPQEALQALQTRYAAGFASEEEVSSEIARSGFVCGLV